MGFKVAPAFGSWKFCSRNMNHSFVLMKKEKLRRIFQLLLNSSVLISRSCCYAEHLGVWLFMDGETAHEDCTEVIRGCAGFVRRLGCAGCTAQLVSGLEPARCLKQQVRPKNFSHSHRFIHPSTHSERAREVVRPLSQQTPLCPALASALQPQIRVTAGGEAYTQPDE